jgi:hypothetical protein
MGKARQINIETRRFDRAGDATAYFSAMLHRYGLGDRVNAEDTADLHALLKRHDEIEEKVGSGIAHFAVDRAPDWENQRCFWIVQDDGNRIDFSYQHCLEKKPYD